MLYKRTVPETPTAAEVLDRLLAGDAFAGIKKCRAPLQEIKLDVAKSVRGFLHGFHLDAATEAILRERERHLRRARALTLKSPEKAKRELEIALLVKPEEFKLDPPKVRWKQRTDSLIIEFYGTLARKTRMDQRALFKAVGQVFRVIRGSFEIVPSKMQGLKAPGAKWKRYAEELVRFWKEHNPDGMVGRGDVLKHWRDVSEWKETGKPFPDPPPTKGTHTLQ